MGVFDTATKMLSAALGGALFLAVPVQAGSVVRIVEPRADDILYGTTRVVAACAPEIPVAHVFFYLDRIERPLCDSVRAPHTCEFFAGREFQSRRIRIVATDAKLRRLGEDTVETLAFVRPQEVVRYNLDVPVVAMSKKEFDLSTVPIDCEFAGKRCEPLSVTRFRATKREPLSVELLIDVSPSVTANREEIVKAVEAILGAFPDNAEMTLVEFAGRYRRLGPYSSEREELSRQLNELSSGVPYTCLYRALDRSLLSLYGRPGHRILFVISDGIDTCDSAKSVLPFGVRYKTNAEALYHTVELSRSVAAPIYIYRVEQLGSAAARGTLNIEGDRAYEGLARETGGRAFATGDLYGLNRAFEDVIRDLQSTYRVNVGLAEGVEPGVTRHLDFWVPKATGVALRYPEYWEPGSRQAAWIAQLDSEIPEARDYAARQLIDSDSIEALRRLVEVTSLEPEPAIRTVQHDAIASIVARLLVLGDDAGRKAALRALDDTATGIPELTGRLRPALAVVQKLEIPDKVKRWARRYLASPPVR